jgi:uncharacterized protein YozE (UPF0346 family)
MPKTGQIYWVYSFKEASSMGIHTTLTGQAWGHMVLVLGPVYPLEHGKPRRWRIMTVCNNQFHQRIAAQTDLVFQDHFTGKGLQSLRSLLAYAETAASPYAAQAGQRPSIWEEFISTYRSGVRN